MQIALVHAPLQSVVSDRELGYQTPLGLLMLAGPLLDHGFQVDLVDAARDRLTDEQIVQRLGQIRPDIVMVGHSASTKAHVDCLRLFLGAKLVEFLYHLHPCRLWRAVATPDRRLRGHFRFAYRHVVGVFWDEVCEFLGGRSLAASRSVDKDAMRFQQELPSCAIVK